MAVSEAGISHKRRSPGREDESAILKKRSPREKVLFGFIFALFAIYALSLIFPFLYMFLNSLKDPYEYLLEQSHLSMPKDWLFSNYWKAFTEMKIDDSAGNPIYFPVMFLNSVWYSVLCTASGVFASALTSYCVAKYRFKLRGVLYGIAIFSMTIPIVGNTGSFFKLIYQLGLYNSPLYPVVTAFGGFGFNFLVLYGFFRSIPWSYAEATFIDGGGHGTVFFRVMLPQAWPALLTLFIMSFIGAWNDYMTMILRHRKFLKARRRRELSRVLCGAAHRLRSHHGDLCRVLQRHHVQLYDRRTQGMTRQLFSNEQEVKL